MKDALESVVVEQLDTAGYDLVELQNRGTKSRPVIEIRIDRRDGQPVTVGDCERVSRLLEQRFDQGSLLSERYVLQVSSPGERLLRTTAEWRRFMGEWANVLSPDHGGRFEGRIIAIEGAVGSEIVVLEGEHGAERRVPLVDIKEARLAFHW